MGIIFDIKRFAVHDGPGIRTTVFLKGCPLSCIWCHNPESISASICTVEKSVSIGEKKITETESVGYKISVDELMKELEKERIFMEESGGGVTFSGGEPLYQAAFLNRALEACQQAGLHTAVDTSGYARRKLITETARNTDLFLYDLKVIDNELHKYFTGVSNEIILSNLHVISELGKNFRVRIPMIPGISFTESNIRNSISFLKELPTPPLGIDLLPFHSTASHKYERFGLDNKCSGMKSLLRKDLDSTGKLFEDAGFLVKTGG